MNKKLILILLSVVMFCSVSYAQKVVKSGSAVIIDCSNMDSKFYSSTKIEPRTTTATNSLDPTNGAADISSPESNAKVYKKFEVHKTDSRIEIDWLNAVDICAELNSNGTGWRLPTQRELMLMWVLKEKLEANDDFTPFTDDGYWSATQSNTYAVWVVDFINGVTYKYNKSGSQIVRCIRDI